MSNFPIRTFNKKCLLILGWFKIRLILILFSALLQYDFETYRLRIYTMQILSISVTTANSETPVLIVHSCGV
jgi:hypothetical protein